MTSIPFYITLVESPLGEMMLGTTDKGICLVDFKEGSRGQEHLKRLSQLFFGASREKNHPHLTVLKDQLSAYFQGHQLAFDLPLDPHGTPFRLKVWQSLLKIPYGTTWSYQHQAQHLNAPQSVRAVASANGHNPLSIIVPCHRVIGANGSLTGYAGGLERKKWLLDLEKNSS